MTGTDGCTDSPIPRLSASNWRTILSRHRHGRRSIWPGERQTKMIISRLIRPIRQARAVAGLSIALSIAPTCLLLRAWKSCSGGFSWPRSKSARGLLSPTLLPITGAGSSAESCHMAQVNRRPLLGQWLPANGAASFGQKWPGGHQMTPADASGVAFGSPSCDDTRPLKRGIGPPHRPL